MQREPTGIKGAKPQVRFKSAKEELPELSRQYLETRNQQMSLKAQAAAMELAQRRGELIEKRLVAAQASYLLVCLRQAILRLPAEVAGRLVGLSDEHAIRGVLKAAALGLLNELKDLPSKVTDENWLSEVEGDGEGPPGPPASPVELKRQADAVERRREKQTAAAQKRRAES